MADEWQRQGKPHFISKRAFQTRQRSAVKAPGLDGIWADLKKWFLGDK